MTQIKPQTDSLKDFVANASHELKTPLMSLNAYADLLDKTKDIAHISDIKSTVKNIDKLLETLILTTKYENTSFDKQNEDIVELIKQCSKDISWSY